MKKQDDISKFIEFYEQHMPKTVYLIRNPDKHNSIVKAIKEIQDYITCIEDSATFNITKDELIGTTLILEIKCSLISLSEVDKFCEALGKCDAIDITPTSDGYLSVMLAFNDAYIPAPPKE